MVPLSLKNHFREFLLYFASFVGPRNSYSIFRMPIQFIGRQSQGGWAEFAHSLKDNAQDSLFGHAA